MDDWTHTLARCMRALDLTPCALIATWPAIQQYITRRRAEGASPYTVAAELWRK